MSNDATPPASVALNLQVGLCAGCRHARIVENRRGSRFWLCGRSLTDPLFPRYPRLPVLRCAGHEPGQPRTGGEEPTDEQRRA